MNINDHIGKDLNWINIATPKNLEPVGTFFAETSISEKLGRVFNNTMFLIVAFQITLKIAQDIPAIKNRVKKFEENISKLPVISTLIKYKIHLIPSVLVARKILAVSIGYLVYPVAKGPEFLNHLRNTLYVVGTLQITLPFVLCISKIRTKVQKFMDDISNLPVISTLIKYDIHLIPIFFLAAKIGFLISDYLGSPVPMGVREDLNPLRNSLIKHFEDIGYKIQSITLNKGGINFNAFIFGPKDKLTNGNWVQVAGGNGWVGEHVIKNVAEKFKGQNILYINGPGVGRSTGFPTSYAIGAAQEAGLQFLEKIGAKRIFHYGTSLGGGAQAAAICAHKFIKDVGYLVWSDRTFNKLSDAASAIIHLPILKFIFPLLGIQLDGVAGAQRLNDLGIKQMITNNYIGENIAGILPKTGNIDVKGTDGVIPNIASLYIGMRNILNSLPKPDLIKFFGHQNVPHNGPLDKSLNDLVFDNIANFFNPLVCP